MQILPIEFYTLDFLQTINDWQKWTSGKKYRNKLIDKMLLLSIPAELKHPVKCCYRVTDFNKYDGRSIIDSGVNESIEFNRITSWTIEYEIAKNFYKAPLKPEIGINYIVKFFPNYGDVIINLDTLYSDDNFHKACHNLKHQIKRYEKGINKYKNTQKEIIIKPMSISIDNIFAFGGYSSNKTELMQKFFNHNEITQNEESFFNYLCKISGAQLGKFWINKDENPDSVKKYINMLKELSKGFNYLVMKYPSIFHK